MALASLSIDLNAKLANLQQGLDKAGRLAERQAAQIERAFSGLKTVGAGVGAALAASLSVAGITQFVRSTVDGIDKLNDLSDATGASIENLSALEDIAARTGTSMDTVGDAVVKLNKVLADAKPGSEAANALKALGLNAEALKRLDPAEALRQVSVALAGFADNGDKARLVQELFGKSVQQVAGLLKDLAEAGRLNGTVTTEQAKAAEAFNKELAAFSKNVTDAARAVTGEMLPALNKFLRELSNARTAYGSIFSGVLDNFSRSGGSLNEELLATAREIREIQDTIARADGGKTKPLFSDQRKDLEAQLVALEKRERFLRLQQRDEGGGRGDIISGAKSVPTLPDLPVIKPNAKPREIEPFVVKFDATTEAAFKRLEGSDAQKIAALRLELQALIEIRARSGAGSVDEAILAVEEAIAALDPAMRAAADAKQRLDAILAQTPSAQLDAVLVDVELLNRAFEAGQIKVERWAEGVRVATARLPDAVQEPLAKIDEFTRQSAANIQDALGDSLLATFEGNTGSIEEIWKNMLRRLVAQAAAAQIGKALLGDSYGSTGQVGGVLGALFDLFTGFGGARANGGPVMAGRPYLVGEMGPEIVVPRTAGTVLPNGVGMSGGAQIDNRIIVQGDASARTLRLIRAGQNMQASRLANEGRY